MYKCKQFYDQMDLNPERRLAITKSIIELTDPVESCDLVEGGPNAEVDSTTTPSCPMMMTGVASRLLTADHSM